MKRWVSLLVISLSSAMAVGQNLDSLLDNLHSLKASFTQNLSIPGQPPQSSEGEVYIQQPNQFRWQVTAPNAQLFVSDGKQLWNDEQDLQQVTVKPLDTSLSATPLLLLSGRVSDIHAVFNIKALGNQRYQFTPKQADDLVQSIVLQFKDEQPVSLTITNHLGQVTEIQFSQVQLNPTLAASLFEFVPGPEDDVLTVS